MVTATLIPRAVCLAILAALLLVPSQAVAATLSKTPNPRADVHVYDYVVSEGEINDLRVVLKEAEIEVTDLGASIQAQEPCRVVDAPHRAVCPLDRGNGEVYVHFTSALGPEADRADVRLAPTSFAHLTLDAGAGDDILTGEAERLRFAGGAGADRLTATGDLQRDSPKVLPRELILEGDSGDDVLVNTSRVGAKMDGGDGDDALSGSDYVTVRRIGRQFRPPYDGDHLEGGPGNDLLGALGGDDLLEGGSGDDLLDSGLGQDLVRGGDGADVLVGDRQVTPTFDPVPIGTSETILPQIEADELAGDGGDDRLLGGAGGDTLDGGEGNDSLEGGVNGDSLTGGGGADELRGGDDRDQARYLDRTAPLTLTLNGLADDGEAGEGDLIGEDVESLFGGQGNDRLVGDSRATALFGAGGDDDIDVGGGIGDFADGGPGNDRLDTRGADPLQGTLASVGGQVPRGILAAPFTDDAFACGGGADVALVDQVDQVSGVCANLRVAHPRLAYPTAGRFTIEMACPRRKGRTRCRGNVAVHTSNRFRPQPIPAFSPPKKLKTGGLRIGKAAFEVPVGRSRRVSLQLTSAGRRFVNRRKSFNARAFVSGRSSPEPLFAYDFIARPARRGAGR